MLRNRTPYNKAIASIPMPERLRRLPVSDTGYPVPWFVAWFDGTPEFRLSDPTKRIEAWRRQLCWLCGDPLGRSKALVMGSTGAITRVVAEPASHRECAIYAAMVCPFLANPAMGRNRHTPLPNHTPLSGKSLDRNPGVASVWITRDYRPLGGMDEFGDLYTFADPTEVQWYAEGRPATRQEVETSITTGLPGLLEIAAQQSPDGVKTLRQQVSQAMRYLPHPETGASYLDH